jgi:hypothetical protein
MGRRVKSFLNQQIDLVSGDVGATAWNSAKANDAIVNCVGCTMPRGWCCKGNVRPMPDRALRHGDVCSAAKLLRI